MDTNLPPPTAEQQAVTLDFRARPRDHRKIIAGAGTGKTTTLRHIAEEIRTPGLYVVFNTIARDTAKAVLPNHVRAMTAHGVAYKGMRMFDQQKRITKRIFPERVPGFLSFGLTGTGHSELVSSTMVLEGLTKFYNSADDQIQDYHFEGLGTAETNYGPIIRAAREIWAQQNAATATPILHDAYLKMFQQQCQAGSISEKYILFDEAQDASPVMISVMDKLGVPITWVGDPHQQIYAFRGAVDALEQHECRAFPLTQSWRFGPAIAEMANAIRSGKMPGTGPSFDLMGDVRKNTIIGHEPPPGQRAILTRTNAEWFGYALEFPGTVHAAAGIEETSKMLLAAHQLKMNNSLDRNAPATIARFRSWGELEKHAEAVTDRELRFLIKVVNGHLHDLPEKIAALKNRHLDSSTHADLIVSTAHGVKGLEFHNVVLAEGFAGPHDPDWYKLTKEERDAELNLLYVAATRAKSYLQPCRAAEVLLEAYRGQVPRINPDKMGQLFGQPLPEKTKNQVIEVVTRFVEEKMPEPTGRPPWFGANEPGPHHAGNAAPGPAAGPAGAQRPAERRIPPAPPPAPLFDPETGEIFSNKPMPSASSSNVVLGSFGQPPYAGGSAAPGAGGAHQEAKPAKITSPVSAPHRWHPSPHADQFLLQRLLAGQPFDVIAAGLRVPEELVVARGLRVLDTPQARALLREAAGGGQIHPDALARMNALALAINDQVEVETRPKSPGDERPLPQPAREPATTGIN